MSIHLDMPCAFQLHKLGMENRHTPSTFIGVCRCIQKIYGLVCTVPRYLLPQAQRLNVSFCSHKNNGVI
jgi:hypothetical protein